MGDGATERRRSCLIWQIGGVQQSANARCHIAALIRVILFDLPVNKLAAATHSASCGAHTFGLQSATGDSEGIEWGVREGGG